MKSYLIALVYALTSGFVGMILPFASGFGVIPHPTNILFGSIYGLGWFVAGFIANVRSRNVELFGSLIWPLLVMTAIVYFLGRQLSSGSRGYRPIVIGIILLALVLPGKLVATTALKYLPLYSSTRSAVY
jgi:hypothetical protein